MKEFDNLDDIFEFAISEEIAANEFYLNLAAKMERPEMKKVFEDFAEEELGHKAKLEAIRAGKQLEFSSEEDVPDLQLADYLVAVEPYEEMDYREALVLAMKKEKAAYRLYLDLASVAKVKVLTDTFLALAQEEAKHKLRFELEYDDVIFQED